MFEVPTEDKEERHEREDHAREPEIEDDHCTYDKKSIDCGLENVRDKTRSKLRHLIDVLFHSVKPFSDRSRFVVVRRKAIHLLQDAEPDAEHEILHSLKAHDCRECGKCKPADVDPEKCHGRKKQQVEIFLWKNAIDQPFDE